MMRRVLASLFLIIILSSCQPDPRKEADAYATKSQADQQALQAQQDREQDAQRHAFEMQQLEQERLHREAIAQQWDIAINALIKSFKFAGVIGVFVLVIAGAVSLSNMMYGLGQAAAQGAQLRANLIHMDKATMSFPLLRHVRGNIYMLANPGTEAVMRLDITKESDRQMIANLGMVQVAGMIAQHAENSNDPTGMAMITPPIVAVNDEKKMITVGADFLRNAIQLRGDKS